MIQIWKNHHIKKQFHKRNIFSHREPFIISLINIQNLILFLFLWFNLCSQPKHNLLTLYTCSFTKGSFSEERKRFSYEGRINRLQKKKLFSSLKRWSLYDYWKMCKRENKVVCCLRKTVNRFQVFCYLFIHYFNRHQNKF